jgi:hypothetical protein
MLMLARLDRGLQISGAVMLPRIVERVVRSFRERLPARVIVESADGDALVLRRPTSSSGGHQPGQQRRNTVGLINDRSHVERRNGEVIMDVLDRGATSLPTSRSVFEPFYRSPRTKKRVGVGVGLAVCKRVIEAQHGRLWAQPREGRAATSVSHSRSIETDA